MRQTASYACVCCVAHTQRRVHFATDRLLVYTRSISIWRSCADLTGIASTTLLLLFFLHTIALILKRRFRYVKKLFWYNCNHTLCPKIDISLSRGGKLRHNSLTAMNRPVFWSFFLIQGSKDIHMLIDTHLDHSPLKVHKGVIIADATIQLWFELLIQIHHTCTHRIHKEDQESITFAPEKPVVCEQN